MWNAFASNNSGSYSIVGSFPSAERAEQVAAELLTGSGKLLSQTGEHPRALIDKVTSPGGTTIEGVLALESKGFSAALHAAVQAVIAKDIKLGKET